MEIKTKTGFGKIGVLMGGPSSEREVSLKSGEAVYRALKCAGIEALAIDIVNSDRQDNLRLLNSKNIDCAFIALHGFFGEDGQMQSILEELDVAYTGSDSKASMLAMDKDASRQIIGKAGLIVPRYKKVKSGFDSAELSAEIEFALPWVIKPVAEGSSFGLSIIDKKEYLPQALAGAFKYGDTIVEEYIRGREITVGILGNVALPVIEVVPKNRFFDYQSKYTPGMADYICPALLEEKVFKKAQESALFAHSLLGCYGFSRVDMILGQDNNVYILELNSLPGLTAISLLPKAARLAGIDFTGLCLRLINFAYEKKEARFSA